MAIGQTSPLRDIHSIYTCICHMMSNVTVLNKYKYICLLNCKKKPLEIQDFHEE